MIRSLTALGLLLSVVACSGQHESSPDAGTASKPEALRGTVEEAPARRTTVEEAAHAFDVAVSIARRGEPWLGGALERKEEGLAFVDGRFAAKGREKQGVLEGDLDVHAALDVREGLTFGLGQTARFDTALRPMGAARVLGAAVDTRAGWHDVWPSTDVLLVSGARFAEWALLLRDGQAPRQFAFEAQLPKSVRSTRVDEHGELVFFDANDEPVLRMRAPFVVDAEGTKRAAQLGWAGGRVVISIDPSGLRYPMVLDPTLDVPVWLRKFTNEPAAPEGPVVVANSSSQLWSVNGTLSETYPAGQYWNYSAITPPIWGNLSPAPSGRRYAGGAIDANGEIVVFGGWQSTGATATWRWYDPTGGTWSTEKVADVSGSALPARVGVLAAPYHLCNFGSLGCTPVADGVAMFGGNNGATVYTDVLLRASTATSFTKLVPTAPASGPPNKRSHGIFVQDGSQLFMAGGIDFSTTTRLADTWSLDMTYKSLTGITAVWTPICGAGGLAACPFTARMMPAGAFDTVRNRAIMVGGDATTGKLADTWELDPSSKTWTALCGTASTPTCDVNFIPRSSAGMTCTKVGAVNKCWMLGGVTTAGAMSTETWEYRVRGNTCTASTQCDSGSCQDGVCCDSATACGSCKSCAVPGKVGVCTPVPFGQTATTCNGASACDGASNCLLQKGQSCTAGTQCLPTAMGGTGFCSDGYCCDAACGGSCDTCAASKGASANGTCTLFAKGSVGEPTCAPAVCDGVKAVCPGGCTSDADCTSASYCAASGKCLTKKVLGDACNAAVDCAGGKCNECASGFCADGVCCSDKCDGLCQACSKARKGTTVEDGKCGYAADGTADSQNRCVDSGTDAATGCKTDGKCGGAGACRYYSNTTTCGSAGATCVGNKASGQFCDGLGTCAPAGAAADCDPYKCVNGVGCPSSCTSDADCLSTAYCNAGVCETKLDLGKACTDARECGSGVCADGNCCERPCDNVCEACNVKGVEGKCAPVIGKSVHGDCGPSDPTKPCDAPSCDGTVRDKCVGRPGADTVCADATCKDGTATPKSLCDGMGTCKPTGDVRKCAPYTCAVDGCHDSCTTNDDCAAPATCDTASGKCVNGGKCDTDGFTAVSADGSTRKDCRPFRCDANGNCIQACVTSDDCVAPNICDAGSKQCVAPEGGGDTGSSGGCATTAGGSGGQAALMFVALAALGLSRRRR